MRPHVETWFCVETALLEKWINKCQKCFKKGWDQRNWDIYVYVWVKTLGWGENTAIIFNPRQVHRLAFMKAETLSITKVPSHRQTITIFGKIIRCELRSEEEEEEEEKERIRIFSVFIKPLNDVINVYITLRTRLCFYYFFFHSFDCKTTFSIHLDGWHYIVSTKRFLNC